MRPTAEQPTLTSLPSDVISNSNRPNDLSRLSVEGSRPTLYALLKVDMGVDEGFTVLEAGFSKLAVHFPDTSQLLAAAGPYGVESLLDEFDMDLVSRVRARINASKGQTWVPLLLTGQKGELEKHITTEVMSAVEGVPRESYECRVFTDDDEYKNSVPGLPTVYTKAAFPQQIMRCMPALFSMIENGKVTLEGRIVGAPRDFGHLTDVSRAIAAVREKLECDKDGRSSLPDLDHRSVVSAVNSLQEASPGWRLASESGTRLEYLSLLTAVDAQKTIADTYKPDYRWGAAA